MPRTSRSSRRSSRPARRRAPTPRAGPSSNPCDAPDREHVRRVAAGDEDRCRGRATSSRRSAGGQGKKCRCVISAPARQPSYHQSVRPGPPSRQSGRRADAFRALRARARARAASSSGRRPSPRFVGSGTTPSIAGYLWEDPRLDASATSTTSTSPRDGGRELLGGKGIGLAEMTQLGVPGPGRLHDHDRRLPRVHGERRELPDGLEDEVDEHLGALEEKTGKRFGDADDPLLVSVRSGAAISMPGMMDTILNLGLNDEAVAGLARATGNPRFANDSYRRLIQMYGEVVDGIDGHRFEQELTELKARARRRAGRRADRRRPGRADRRRTSGSTARRPAAPFPQDAARAADAGGPRRLRLVGLAARAGLPAHVRHPGRPRHGGQRRADGVRQQGRRVAARASLHARPVDRRAGALRRVPRRTRRARTSSPGSARPSRSSGWSTSFPTRSSSCSRRCARLEEHYRDMQDIEFTVEDGRALPPPDALGEAHGGGGGEGRGRDGRRGADLAARRRSRGSIPRSSTSSCIR